ncbi:fluoride efflux transporter FluC [Microbacterium sp. CH12i]|uniref:fluoride efflux transporter FluC n=1 Tax=Microbacterium sp. CH12i TaxID=1479651 RepID=UPI001F3E2A36|nr:CrcB family protein [Microbacterium sp. CH12i]
MTLRRLLLVFAGGVIGTAFRLSLSFLIPDAGIFPTATFAVNIIGALLIGVLAARPFDRLGDRGADLRVFLGTGILGGFTTYSAFAVGTIQLWADAPLLAGAYALATLVLGICAAFAGLRIGRPGGAR